MATSPACRASSPRPRRSGTCRRTLTEYGTVPAGHRRRAHAVVGQATGRRDLRGRSLRATARRRCRAETLGHVVHAARLRRSSTRRTVRTRGDHLTVDRRIKSVKYTELRSAYRATRHVRRPAPDPAHASRLVDTATARRTAAAVGAAPRRHTLHGQRRRRRRHRPGVVRARAPTASSSSPCHTRDDRHLAPPAPAGRLRLAGDCVRRGQPSSMPGPEGRFTVSTIRRRPGTRRARRPAATHGQHGTRARRRRVCTVPSTPVLKWDADPRASYYMVYVASDPSFTNLLEPSNARPRDDATRCTPRHSTTPRHTYPDSQAGRLVLLVTSVPCRNDAELRPDPVSQTDVRAGHVQEAVAQDHGVTSRRPAARAGDEVTFTWADYWDTNQERAVGADREKRPQAAKQYRIEVRRRLVVRGGAVDDELVDQPTYTSPDQALPRGQRCTGGCRPSTPTTTVSRGPTPRSSSPSRARR